MDKRWMRDGKDGRKRDYLLVTFAFPKKSILFNTSVFERGGTNSCAVFGSR